jgi:hypothetical protein
VFGILVSEEHVHAVDTISWVVAITVGLSVLLHGMSAAPLAARYGRWYTKAAATVPDLRESAITPVTPRRRRLGPLDDPGELAAPAERMRPPEGDATDPQQEAP